MDGSHPSILYIPVQELVEWIDGREHAPLPELASWPSPLPARPPCLDNFAPLSVWNNYTNQTNPSSLSNRQLVPLSTTHAPDASQTAPTTELISSPSSNPSSLETIHSITGFSIILLKPQPTHIRTVLLPRIETHVYLDIHLPSRSWNAIQLPLTKSVTSDDSSSIREGIKPLLLVITVRGATTRQERNRVCEQCEKRMGNKTGPPGLLDFHSPSNILTPKRGIVQVHFTFTCYSRHHQKKDEQFVLEVVLKDTSNPSEPIVVRKELPYSFDVRSSKPRIKEPTSDQLQQANTGPSSRDHEREATPRP